MNTKQVQSNELSNGSSNGYSITPELTAKRERLDRLLRLANKFQLAGDVEFSQMCIQAMEEIYNADINHY